MEEIGPAFGARVRVFWTGERRWFKGTVGRSTKENGCKIYSIVYDDGDTQWHDMTQEIWLSEPTGKAKTAGKSAAAASPAAAAKPTPAAPPRVAEAAAKPPNGSKRPSSSPAGASSMPPKAKTKRPKAKASTSAPSLPDWARGCGRAPSPAAAESPRGGPPLDLPSLVSLSAADVEVFPCGVIKVKNAIPVEARQRLWDTVLCAGFDYREVAQGNKDNQGANMWYTKAAGAPDILLHYNYYEPPTAEQPPPMAVLCAADSVFREVAKLEVAKNILEPRNAEDEDEEDEEDAQETASEGTSAATGIATGSLVRPGTGGADDIAAARARATGTPMSAGESGESIGGDDGSGADEGGGEGSSGGAGPGGGASRGADALGSGEGASGDDGSQPSSQAKKAKRERPEKAAWVDEAAADLQALAENVAKTKEFEERRLLWPRRPNFRSVLAIGYRSTDTFRWHTDLAGEEGWVCSLSVGATSTFEYLPTAAPSALRRARARAEGNEVSP